MDTLPRYSCILTFSEQQRSLDAVRQQILNAVSAQYLEATALPITQQSSEFTRHYSQTTCPIFRHIPKEDLDTPSGWVYGLTAVRSYFDLINLYWRQWIRVRQSTISVDPVKRSCRFVLDIDWTWCKAGISGWSEIVECNQMYDLDYKVVKAEYITLSGRETCWSVMNKTIHSERKVCGIVSTAAMKSFSYYFVC